MGDAESVVSNMLIADSEAVFRRFLTQRGAAPDGVPPREMLALGFEFFETVRATDALPLTEEDFGDALLFQWGAREALLPHYGACFYVDLTRQFIAQVGEDDDAMFQLTWQIQYELVPELRVVPSGHRWCSGLAALPAFKDFALSHPAVAAAEGRAPMAIEFYLTPI